MEPALGRHPDVVRPAPRPLWRRALLDTGLAAVAVFVVLGLVILAVLVIAPGAGAAGGCGGG
jgi:hypothetical protein